MKYVIVEINGKQIWMEKGKFYDLNRIPIKLNSQIVLNRVLLIRDQKSILIGKPYLTNIKIYGRIINHFRGNKLTIYKMQSKKKTRKTQGHRQELTRIFIENIFKI